MDESDTVNKPLVGEAIQGILAEQFRDELAHGTPDHRHGTDAEWRKHSDFFLKRAKEDLTFTNLLLCQAFEVASKTNVTELRGALESLGGTVVQWLEKLEREA